jgi:hypothetical protein
VARRHAGAREQSTGLQGPRRSARGTGDAKNDNFIKTIEAEDLHTALGRIAERFGIEGWEDLVDAVRDW